MASNYDGEEMELGTPHQHSDGDTSEEVTAFHSGAPVSPGGSASQEPGLSKTDEKQVTDSPVQDSEASTGTPRQNTGRPWKE
ncbi:MAG: hypothetical protein KGL39_14970 [Patescibacteria group bacterium]|nr:hypothetical protein [Patescibacteria group bacterium]